MAPKEVICPACLKGNSLYLHDLASHYVCKSCDKYIHIGEHKAEDNKNSGSKVDLFWPIGKTGIIRGVNYQFVGAVLRKESGQKYTWLEYCLFNPFHGFAYLTEYTGNWILLKETHKFPQTKVNTHTIANDEGEEYQLFLRYKTDCVKLVGEFPYDAKDETVKLIKEFINPPIMYLMKEYSHQTVWFKGEHISFKELTKAFGDAELINEKIGKGSIEPQILGMWYTNFGFYAALCLLLMVVFTFVAERQFEPKKVFSHVYEYSYYDTSNRVQVSNSFKLEEGINNLEFNFGTQLEQNWIELEVTLVNEDHEEEYTLTKEMYFYSGSDDEGYWKDGANNWRDVFCNIPAGNYHLIVTPYTSPKQDNVSVVMDVYRGVPIESNLYWFGGLLAILVYIQYLRVMNFERNRWSNSNYSAYDHRSWFERNLGE